MGLKTVPSREEGEVTDLIREEKAEEEELAGLLVGGGEAPPVTVFRNQCSPTQSSTVIHWAFSSATHDGHRDSWYRRHGLFLFTLQAQGDTSTGSLPATSRQRHILLFPLP
ncbi:unnamed protein product [Discosporangium mesarthrocarpum]